MTSELVIDANLWLQATLPVHPYHTQARQLIFDCVAFGIRFIAPLIWEDEIHRGLRCALASRLISPHAHKTAIGWIDLAEVTVIYDPIACRSERMLADNLKHPHLYDATYVALAQRRGCEMWTGDQRLSKAASAANLPFVRFVGSYHNQYALPPTNVS